MKLFPATLRALALLLLLLSLLPVSCSIKEDRSACPCLLRLDFSALSPEDREGTLLLGVRGAEEGNGGGFSYSGVVDLASVGDVYEVEVPRSGVWVNLWSESAADCIGESGLVIPFGADCPPVRMFSSFVETDCETTTATVSLLKNYCRLTVNFSEERTSFPFDIAVRSNVDGYGMDGEPHSGEFSHYMRATLKSVASGAGAGANASIGSLAEGSEEGLMHQPADAAQPLPAAEVATEVSCSLCLPRQRDSSLSLEIAEDASVLKSFALGNYIEGSGYDWSAPELDDIVVTIDYARTRLSISVGEWERSYSFDVVF